MADRLSFTGLIDTMVEKPNKADATYTKLEELIQHPEFSESIYLLQKESALHYAVKRFKTLSKNERQVVEDLVKRFPQMILSVPYDSKYEGQTPFHMAVCKGNAELVQLFLDNIGDVKHDLLEMRATGEIFKNTVMMAEIPLSIAALTFNKETMRQLLEHEAPLDGANSRGDNVCHSLIRYAFLYPDKQDQVLEMFRFLAEDVITDACATFNVKLRKKIWVMHNLEGLTPLRLSAMLGQHVLFQFIMELEVYCSLNSDDGMFDIKVYDITEIDAISSLTISEVGGKEDDESHYNITNRCTANNASRHYKSVLMILLELEPSVAFHFLLIQPVRRIIDEKWSKYIPGFYAVWAFFFLFTGILIWYCIERAQQDPNSLSGFDINVAPKFKSKIASQPFVTVFTIIALVVAFILICLEIIRCVAGRMPYTVTSFTNPYSNGWFRLFLVLISLLLIIDTFAATLSSLYENYCLLVAMILVCFCNIYFIRVLKTFSFITVLITKVIIGDMFRFFVIIGIEMVAFNTAMYMSIQGSNVIFDTNFSHYGRVFFSMVTLMVGLGDTANFYDTRHAELTIAIFVTFVIFTTLLMINSLIAMISRTCSELFENVGDVKALDRHWHLQRLSMILFIESILPASCICNVGEYKMVRWYVNNMKKRAKLPRYSLTVRSNQDENGFGECSSSTWGPTTRVLHNLASKVSHVQKQVRLLRRQKRMKNEADTKPSLVTQETQTDQPDVDESLRQSNLTPVQSIVEDMGRAENPRYSRSIDLYLLTSENHFLEDTTKF